MATRIADLKAEYGERGYTLIAKPRGVFEVKRIRGASEEGLIHLTRDNVEDISGTLRKFATKKTAYQEREAFHGRMGGKHLWEMSFDEWERWDSIHADAGSLMSAVRTQLFPDTPLSELRRRARSHPNLVVGYVHQVSVEKALAEGRNVPSRVLKDYPGMRRLSCSRPALVGRGASGESSKRQKKGRTRRLTRSGVSTMRL